MLLRLQTINDTVLTVLSAALIPQKDDVIHVEGDAYYKVLTRRWEFIEGTDNSYIVEYVVLIVNKLVDE